MTQQIDIARAWALIETHLANLRFERVIDYLRRGRRHTSKSTRALKHSWRTLQVQFDDVSGAEDDWTRLHDMEAELTLRHESLPRPWPARGICGRWRENHLARLRGDPGFWGFAEESAFKATLAFETACRNAVKH